MKQKAAVKQKAEAIIRLLFPGKCLVCREVLGQGDVCPACREKLPADPIVRVFHLEDRLFQVYAPMSYEGGYRESLHRFKFHDKYALDKGFAGLMAPCVKQTRFDLVTFVPMTRKKQNKRGYNQSERLARQVAALLGLSCMDTLEKIKNNATQHELDEPSRMSNVTGVYSARGRYRNKRVLLIDDIVTTGATIGECARVLYAAGAAEVTGLCAANAEMRLIKPK